MRRTLLSRAIAAAALSAALPAVAQPLDGSAVSGRRIATAICSTCHQVSPADPPRIELPASFEAIANLPSTTALSLNVFLRSSHKDMPNVILSKSDADDVVAYILSLKR